jgi:rhomboid protease GluP
MALPTPLIARLRSRSPRASATMWLVAVNIAVFVAMLAAGAGLWHSSNAVQLAWGANFGPATKDGEWWRLASAMFLHFGLLHLALNTLALVEVGMYVERFVGSSRFLVIYIGSGLGGNLLSLVIQGDRGISGGASGAVFGVYAALLYCLWRERQTLSIGEFRWLFLGGIVFTLFNIVLGFMVTGIDNGAHIGGLVSGLLLAGALPGRTLDGVPLPRGFRIGAGLVLLMGVFALAARIPAPSYDWSDEQLARDEIRHFVASESGIVQHWNALLAEGRRGGLSFEELASRIDSEVAGRYEESFEHLSSMRIDPRVPSMPAIDRLRDYAGQRRDASQELAAALRTGDAQRIRRAVAKARSARLVPKDHAATVTEK